SYCYHVHVHSLFLFFFQAEDGIRDFHVTGVQTCALPICGDVVERELTVLVNLHVIAHEHAVNRDVDDLVRLEALARHGSRLALRSEERRVGKEWRWRGWPQR